MSTSRPSLAEVRAVAQAGVIERRSAEHWAGRLYMRGVSGHVTRWVVSTRALDRITPDQLTVLMIVAGTSRPCSGACHEISHALDAYHGSPGLHGAQVAFGARFATWLRGEEELFGDIDRLMAVHQLPRSPVELGIDRDTFVQAVIEAPTTRPDRFTILEHLAPSPARVEELVDAYLTTLPG